MVASSSASPFFGARSPWLMRRSVEADTPTISASAGEACNLIKKLNRARDGLTGNGAVGVDELRAKLAAELADTAIYLDLLAQAAGVDLSDAIASKFNAVSERNGFPERVEA
jgi:NTP pyrophosphatase (non-canonical NTP hydrolase)